MFEKVDSSNHSHKKWKDSLNVISVLCWNLTSGPEHRGSLQKKHYLAFPEGNKLFAGDLPANLDETNADMVHLTKRWNWKWIV